MIRKMTLIGIKKRKRPHEEEVPPIKGRRTSRICSLVDLSTKGKKDTHPSSLSVLLDPTKQSLNMGTPNAKLTVDKTP